MQDKTVPYDQDTDMTPVEKLVDDIRFGGVADAELPGRIVELVAAPAESSVRVRALTEVAKTALWLTWAGWIAYLLIGRFQ